MSNPKVGDIGVNFVYTLRRNGTVIDLTGKTVGNVQLTYQSATGSNVTVTPTTISNAASGIISYLVSSTTFLSSAGQWLVQGLYVASTTEQIHSDQVQFEIDPVL